VTAGLSGGARKVRTPKGRTLGKSQAAKADGKWHRKETANGERLSAKASLATPPGGRAGLAGTAELLSPEVRVKRWGKSPPAPW
jgi:hypothetical protein